MPALDAEDGELMTGAMNLEAFEGSFGGPSPAPNY
jgi:hypothetical protein